MDILAILNRVEALLKESGHSKSELYAACSVSASAISQWKSGKTSPATKSLQSIADYLNVSYEYLISGVGQKQKAPAPEGGREVAQTEDEEDMLLLARHMEPIPEEDRKQLKEQFKKSIDLYLKARGLSEVEDK